MLPDLTIITPVLPARSRFLPEAGQSVRRTAAAFSQGGLCLEWVVVIDGPGRLHCPEPEADTVIRLPARSGVSAARNTGLHLSRSPWVFPLDADDEAVPAGLMSLLRAAEAGNFAWSAGNRLLTGGQRTAHWFDDPRHWAAGDLAADWSAPFAFHPNSVVVQREQALAIGGWPSVPVNEDMGLILTLSEACGGIADPAVVTIYRPWTGQMVADPAYPELKAISFGILGDRINILRAAAGRHPVSVPVSGGAHGVITR